MRAYAIGWLINKKPFVKRQFVICWSNLSISLSNWLSLNSIVRSNSFSYSFSSCLLSSLFKNELELQKFEWRIESNWILNQSVRDGLLQINREWIESRWRRSASLITVSQPLAADRKAGYHGVRDTVWKTSVKKAGGSWRDRGKFIGESRASAIGKCASVYLGTTRKLPEGGAILHTCTHRRAHREEERELVFTVTCKLSKRSLSPLWFFRNVLFLLRLRLISYTYLRWFGIWNFILWEVNCVWYLENYPNI